MDVDPAIIPPEISVSPSLRAESLTSASAPLFAAESIASCWSEGIPLMYANHAEVGGLDGRTFCPNRAAFEKLEDFGSLRLFTMRIEGELVGYGLFVVAHSLNYTDSLIATVHTVYVKHEYRGRRALRFMLWQDKVLKSEGVTDLCRQSPKRLPNGRIYEHMGYREVETIYVKAV